MPPTNSKSSDPLPDYKTIAAQFAAAKRAKEAQDAERQRADAGAEKEMAGLQERQRLALEKRRKNSYEARWWWTVGFWFWLLCIHATGIAYFASGFLLTRLVLEEKSTCAVSPLNSSVSILPDWSGKGTVEGGCWHPKTFERAVVILIDALRYDFTVPVEDNAPFHNAFPFMHDTALASPNNAFLRPFIADPPTATLQRLKGLTTGTLPTFVDAGSNFAGTAIDEDNLLMQLRDAGKRIVHIGDDTWVSLFPDHFEANMSQAYDSFNVWDLHSVDNGVAEHIFPALKRKGDWDLLIGHCLGVDHAGHRYGPNHAEMGKKLQQMDTFVREVAAALDDGTLLVVMGDHGMDGKGDHGGESDDEIEAAIWMYSSRPVFGRTKPEFVAPPKTAKTRPVNQIDFVPTLALLLGIPIPYNNLGHPIEEAFVGVNGNAWDVLAAAERVTAAGIRRYQASYFAARGIDQATGLGSPAHSWDLAEALTTTPSSHKPDWHAVFSAFALYQDQTLQLCKSLWARFDVPNMIFGVVIMALGLVVLLVYVSRNEEEELAALDNLDLDLAEKSLELQGVEPDASAVLTHGLSRALFRAGVLGAVPSFGAGMLHSFVNGGDDWYRGSGFAALTSSVAVLVALYGADKTVRNLLPRSIWGWMAVVLTVSQSAGFASNSFTIWEDSILLFFITTFGFVSTLASLRITSLPDRYMAVYHSILFVLLARLASFSKLCREEQMPYCTSTYYSSATSSTSAPWQLVIPFLVVLILPSIIKAYLTATRSYEGLAPTWIGYILRVVLFFSAVYWVMDSADNGNWVPGLPEKLLKRLSVYMAQVLLGLAFVVGSTAFAWAPPNVSIMRLGTKTGRAQIHVFGYGNAHGARYLYLPLNILAACFLLSKPMGGGTLALLLWQILSLVEILDLNDLAAETIGPIMLGVLGNYYFFKTGHQATPSSIQWDSAFIPLFAVRYPWTPLVVIFNSFAGQIIAAVALPLVALWKVDPKRKGLLESVTRALGVFVAYYAVESLATMAWAGWLRRHLMLYRIFNPRFIVAAAVLLVVDCVGILVALTGVRSNTVAISEVFGWAE
ncbi:hypothetical protein GQ53DRAFT_737997 [Thozetella sp. PMI_491]|nr:hypothetical protein GQ53DRAFT_737997 [Thozetella sp. PMI_491]